MSLSNWLRKRFSHPDTNLYTYHMGPIFTNGAQDAVFNQETSLPTILARGASRNAGSLAVLQPAQLRVNLSVPAVGVGGLQSGQIIFQPLVHSEDIGSI